MKNIEFLKISLCYINPYLDIVIYDGLSIKTKNSIEEKIDKRSMFWFGTFYDVMMEEYYIIKNKLDNDKKKK